MCKESLNSFQAVYIVPIYYLIYYSKWSVRALLLGSLFPSTVRGGQKTFWFIDAMRQLAEDQADNEHLWHLPSRLFHSVRGERGNKTGLIWVGFKFFAQGDPNAEGT